MQHIKSLLEVLTGKLETVAQSDAVVGKPIELGGVTLVPLSRISLGFGGGGGEGEGEGIGPSGNRGSWNKKSKSDVKISGTQKGGMSGGGAKVRPVGLAIFSKDGVEVLPIADKASLFDKLYEKIPQLMEMAKDFESKKRS